MVNKVNGELTAVKKRVFGAQKWKVEGIWWIVETLRVFGEITDKNILNYASASYKSFFIRNLAHPMIFISWSIVRHICGRRLISLSLFHVYNVCLVGRSNPQSIVISLQSLPGHFAVDFLFLFSFLFLFCFENLSCSFRPSTVQSV